MYVARKLSGRAARWAIAAALAFAVFPFASFAQPAASAAATQASSDQGVTVKVTPKQLGPANARWEFGVVFDTHAGQLDDDPTQTTILVTDDGRVLKPTAWIGAGPGGHHREGLLTFDAPNPRPAAIELKMTRQGESGARSFRWKF